MQMRMCGLLNMSSECYNLSLLLYMTTHLSLSGLPPLLASVAPDVRPFRVLRSSRSPSRLPPSLLGGIPA